ncbi:MAG TPA: phosphatidylglycerophosphatase A [Rhizomicrobium sp.]|jgi:phosphatidylglycerophosphatase A
MTDTSTNATPANPTPANPPPGDWPRTIATVFGLGFVRVAPGTVASIAALPVAWIVADFGSRFWLLFLAIMTTAIGAWACELYSRATLNPDPSECVIDEVAAQFLICAIAPLNWFAYLLAFVLFRILDITKLWPINAVEKNVPGGMGIMLDDTAAALIGGVVIAILAHLGLV